MEICFIFKLKGYKVNFLIWASPDFGRSVGRLAIEGRLYVLCLFGFAAIIRIYETLDVRLEREKPAFMQLRAWRGK